MSGVYPLYLEMHVWVYLQAVPEKNNRLEFNISVTIQYRIIIVSLLCRVSSPTRFDMLMAGVHQKAIAHTPTPLQPVSGEGGRAVEWYEGR